MERMGLVTRNFLRGSLNHEFYPHAKFQLDPLHFDTSAAVEKNWTNVEIGIEKNVLQLEGLSLATWNFLRVS